MTKQLIIAIGREYGTGGHDIAKELAARFGIQYYDRNILDEIAEEKNIEVKNLETYDKRPKRVLFSRTVRGYSNSPEQVIAEMQFDFLRKKAAAGESFVIVGRCAEYILKDYDCMVSIFITGDMACKIKRTMETRNMTKREAEAAIKRHDKHRKIYYYHNTNLPWGAPMNHDLIINANTLGLEKTTDFLEQYIRTFQEEA